MNRHNIHSRLYELFCITALCALPFSKWLSSVSIILLSANWLLEGNFKNKLNTLKKNIPALLMLASFSITACGLLYTTDKSLCNFIIQKKLSFLAFGIVLGSVQVFNEFNWRKLFYAFSLAVTIASVICFALVFTEYLKDNSTAHFFYHSLGAPLQLHAVYFSVWIYIAISFLLLELINSLLNKLFRIVFTAGILWLSLFLILLSSKLVIAIFLISIVLILVLNLKGNAATKATLAICLLIIIAVSGVLFTQNPVNRRFEEIKAENAIVDQSKISPATELNGLNFRILFWKFGYQILAERKAWIWGVSPSDSQRLLNEKIVASNLYTGEKGKEGNGFLNYNFHNQFVETAVQSGIISTLLLVNLLLVFVWIAICKRNLLFLLTIMVFLCFFLTESALERQMGIVPFSLLSLVFAKLNPAWAPRNQNLP